LNVLPRARFNASAAKKCDKMMLNAGGNYTLFEVVIGASEAKGSEMTKTKNELTPPGTRIAPRQNLGAVERGLSLLAGAAMGAAASRQKGGAAAALGIAGSLLVARGLTGASPAQRLLGQAPDERAYAQAHGRSSAALVARSVTINASRAKVFERLRNFADWPEFSVNVLNVEPVGKDQWRWTANDTSGPVSWTATVTEQVADRLIALKSDKNTPAPINSRFELRDAPGGRGTEVHGVVAYQPRGGSLGRYASKLTQREPGIQLRRDLKRLKSLIEAGEIATNAPQGAAPKA
jgi:uncharacterized membrane protein